MDKRQPMGLVGLMLLFGASCAAEDKDASAVDAAAGGSAESANTLASEQGTLGDPSVRARLRDLALQFASANGISSPRILAVASADREAAEQALSGDLIPNHEAVYVVVVTGGTFMGGHHPPGVPAPLQGSVLTLTVDAAAYDVTGLRIVNTEPDLSKISPVIVDLSTT